MRPDVFVAAAGVPPEVAAAYAQAFTKLQQTHHAYLISLLKLHPSACYTDDYAVDLYAQLACRLKRREPIGDMTVLSDKNLILLYVNRADGSEAKLVERFGIEALIVPLNTLLSASTPLKTGGQRNSVVNRLIQETRSAINHARRLLAVIAEEVTNRANRTCLLLPPDTFGKEFDRVVERISSAAHRREEPSDFRKALRSVSRSLSKKEGRYFERKGLVFKSPGKARHGLAPSWSDDEHNSSCVIRGRLRFGASYDPRFHYDCAIAKGASRHFPGCHEPETVPQSRSYVNVAPNDNVRY